MTGVRHRKREMVEGIVGIHRKKCAQTATLGGLPYTGLRAAILTHPTTAEGLNVLLTNVPPDASAAMRARALARGEGKNGRVQTAKNRKA
jgi:hypothetical protein